MKFGLFSKRKKELSLIDYNGMPLKDGDVVVSLRYDLGECKLERIEGGFEYVSINSGERVSWLRMIDASTERQKVHLKQ